MTWSSQEAVTPWGVGLLHRDVHHEAGRGGAVPVLLAWFEQNTVARPNGFDRAAAALAEADPFDDEDRLAVSA